MLKIISQCIFMFTNQCFLLLQGWKQLRQAAARRGCFLVQKATAVILDINKDRTLLWLQLKL